MPSSNQEQTHPSTQVLIPLTEFLAEHRIPRDQIIAAVESGELSGPVTVTVAGPVWLQSELDQWIAPGFCMEW